jgi:tRNA A58 N-methylase Trm61
LLHTVRTGENAFAHQHGMPVFAWFQQHPEQFRTFDRAMTNIHGPEDTAIAAAYDFSEARTVADVGGGRGTLLAAILAANPHLNGILFDMPQVIEHARKSIGGNRVEFMSGDFFESVPHQADVYLMRHIIHDWNDEQAIAILRRCREAMHASARLVIAEPVIPQGNDPHMGKMMDLHMMVVTGGKERSEAEYRELLGQAGFRLSRVIPTPAQIVDLIEGIPA